MSVVLFDKDGVLIDSEEVALARHREFMTYKGLPWEENKLLTMIGGNLKNNIRLYKEWWGDDFDVNSYNEEKKKYFKGLSYDYEEILMPHVRELLSKLNEFNDRMSVVSSASKKEIQEMVDTLHLNKFFDYLITGNDFSKSKPDPAIYLYARQLYSNYPTEDIFVVEDSTVGIEAGKRAGLKVIALKDHRYGMNQEKADYLIEDLMEIIDIVHLNKA